MSPHEFCDECPGCRPALLDLSTGQPLSDSHPMMARVLRIWRTDTSYAQRKAFIMVTFHNSRARDDLRLAREVIEKFGEDVPSL